MPQEYQIEIQDQSFDHLLEFLLQISILGIKTTVLNVKYQGIYYNYDDILRSLYMQSFEISQCKGSTFYICDATAATYIMNCDNCNIVIGPTEDTISIKDCQNCKFILAAKEVRITNSSHCDFLLYCKDKPSLERCNTLRFGCYDFSYFEMQSIYYIYKYILLNRTNGIM